MGRQIETTLRLDGRIHDGTAALERGALVFRGGGLTLELPFEEIFGVEANAGWLDLRTSRGLVLLQLGVNAERWAEKIKNPKALAERLGLDGTKKVAVVGKLDPDLREELDGSGARVAKSARGKGFDAVFLAAAAKKDLEKLPSARELIKDEGAIWVVFPTGREDPRERDVLIAGRTLQLSDSKPVQVGDGLTAVRFHVPAAARKKR